MQRHFAAEPQKRCEARIIRKLGPGGLPSCHVQLSPRLSRRQPCRCAQAHTVLIAVAAPPDPERRPARCVRHPRRCRPVPAGRRLRPNQRRGGQGFSAPGHRHSPGAPVAAKPAAVCLAQHRRWPGPAGLSGYGGQLQRRGSHKVYPGSPFIIQRCCASATSSSCSSCTPPTPRPCRPTWPSWRPAARSPCCAKTGLRAQEVPASAQRRALVLCDPSYEIKSDYAARGHRHANWPTR
jgi:hypothetical protein